MNAPPPRPGPRRPNGPRARSQSGVRAGLNRTDPKAPQAEKPKQGVVVWWKQLLDIKAVLIPMACWVAIWGNINSGPWNFDNTSSLMNQIHAARAAVPFFVFPICLIFLNASRSGYTLWWSGPSKLLLIYGFIALGASFRSLNGWYAFYWGFVFLAAIVCGQAMLSRDRPTLRAKQLWLLSMMLILGFAAAAVYLNQEILSATGERGAYGFYTEKDTVGGMANTRSSGIGRMAAIPVLFFVTRFFFMKHPIRFALLVPIAFFAFVVYQVHSRGAALGLMGGIGVILILTSISRKSVMIMVLVGLAGLAVRGDFGKIYEKVDTYLQRGQTEQSFRSMTGRTRDWADAVEVIKKSPFVGHGNWADRYLIGIHVHNTYIQALLNAGVLGLIPLVLSWLVSWLYAYRIWQRRKSLPPDELCYFVEVTAILTFFTLRSIPETTTASFSIDQLLMIPVFLYLEAMWRQMERIPVLGVELSPSVIRSKSTSPQGRPKPQRPKPSPNRPRRPIGWGQVGIPADNEGAT